MTTDIKEIHQDRWGHFFDDFSKQHAGKKINVEAYGPGTNPHREINSLPFVGIVYEPKSNDIEIIVGTEPANHVSHTITNPIHVWVRPDEIGDILEVRSDDGVTCLLRFAGGS